MTIKSTSLGRWCAWHNESNQATVQVIENYLLLSEETSMSLVSHEDNGIRIVISPVKWKKIKGRNPNEYELSWWTQVKDCHKHDLGFGDSHTVIAKVK